MRPTTMSDESNATPSPTPLQVVPPRPEGGRSLVRKLAEVMAAIGHVEKNGRNAHFNYDFATEADIVAAVRGEMAQRHLILMPDVEKVEWREAAGRGGPVCTLTVRYTLEDGESGEVRTFTVLGEGQDSGDKGTYKAMTGATKYALLKLFLIPTGDDPENDGGKGREPESATGKKDAPRASSPRSSSAPAPAAASTSSGAPMTPLAKAKAERDAKAASAAKAEEPAPAVVPHGPEFEAAATWISLAQDKEHLLSAGRKIKAGVDSLRFSEDGRKELEELYHAKEKDLRQSGRWK